MSKNRTFQNVRTLHPARSVFDLSYEKKFTCDMAQLIPVMCDEVVPGDFFKLGTSSLIRFQPLVAPIMHQVNVYVHFFFVPYRLLWDSWEDFITGGPDGEDVSVLPRWEVVDNAIGSLWDFLGFPTGVDPAGAYPLDFPRRAYNLIYNEYYRDENLQDEILLDNETILNRCWEKDYFTSALPWQQRGVGPALPVSGTTSAVWPASAFGLATGGCPLQVDGGVVDPRIFVYNARGADNLRNALNNNTVDLSTASTFDIADLRLAFQIQKFLERNARAGVRYVEFLRAHFGVSPRDDRLQRPEYIGGNKSSVIVSEVLQTSSTDATSAQGNLAGHGISIGQGFCGKYHAEEFGLIMGIMSVMPRSVYQQGIDRQWLRRSKYDFFFPEFVGLSEQGIEQAEIYATNVESENQTLFGYQGRYDEMRVKKSMVCSQMRTTFDYYHISRQFSSAPLLNENFVKCVPRKDIFAAPSEPGLIVNCGNIIQAFRPLPVIAEPGLIDHY